MLAQQADPVAVRQVELVPPLYALAAVSPQMRSTRRGEVVLDARWRSAASCCRACTGATSVGHRQEEQSGVPRCASRVARPRAEPARSLLRIGPERRAVLRDARSNDVSGSGTSSAGASTSGNSMPVSAASGARCRAAPASDRRRLGARRAARATPRNTRCRSRARRRRGPATSPSTHPSRGRRTRPT